MKAGEVCINDIFNGARLIEVPFYQERFLTDMEYVSDTQRHYFLGSIILKNGETPNMTDAFSSRKIIIDGQQRLTTLILFFKVLCLKVGCNGYFDHDFRFSNGDIAMQKRQRRVQTGNEPEYGWRNQKHNAAVVHYCGLQFLYAEG